MDQKQLVILALQVSIVSIVFSFGLRSTSDDLLYLLRRPGLLLRSLLAVLVIMPVLAVVLTRLFDLRDTVEVTLIALAISPMPPLLPKKEVQAGGRRSYALALMATMAALAVVAVPLAVELLARYSGRPFGVPPGGIARIVLVTVFLPLLAGLAVRAMLPGSRRTPREAGRPCGHGIVGAGAPGAADGRLARHLGRGRRRNLVALRGVRGRRAGGWTPAGRSRSRTVGCARAVDRYSPSGHRALDRVGELPGRALRGHDSAVPDRQRAPGRPLSRMVPPPSPREASFA